MAIDDLDRNSFIKDHLSLVTQFLFSEFPFVRKTFSEEFFTFLTIKGEELFSEEQVAELTEFLSDGSLAEDEGKSQLFRERWSEITK